MSVDPNTISDPEKLRRLLANAVRLSRDDVARDCRRRIFELAGVNTQDPIEARLWQAVAAYEELLREKHGRQQRASYTRRKIEQKGAVQTLTDWAIDPKVTPGFEALVKNGLAEFTGEYVVLEYEDRFPAQAVEAARKKLGAHGIHVASKST
jgi:hypothetical protein